MLVPRLVVSILLIPVGMFLIAIGGWPFGLFVTLFLGVAAWEYWHLFRISGFTPSSVLVIGGVVILALATVARQEFVVPSSEILLVILTLAAMAFHLVEFERGRDRAATDFGITLGGILYLGLVGSYLIILRNIPQGEWWILVVLPSVWIADSGAFLIGSHFGRHKLSPRLSPKKTWEGYFGGIVFGVLAGALLAALWHLVSPPVTFERGALIGLVISVLSPFGDLGESMIKRQAGVKDSSHILPGHGGVFDRIDSWLWAGVIGFIVIQFFI